MVVIRVEVIFLVAEGLAALEVHLRVTGKLQYCSWIYEWKLVSVIWRDTPLVQARQLWRCCEPGVFAGGRLEGLGQRVTWNLCGLEGLGTVIGALPALGGAGSASAFSCFSRPTSPVAPSGPSAPSGRAWALAATILCWRACPAQSGGPSTTFAAESPSENGTLGGTDRRGILESRSG